MNEKLYEHLELSISKTRLDRYSKILKTQDKKIIFTYYILNSEIAKSLYIPLQNLEVALRNSIHNTLTSYYETEHWYNNDDFLLPNELNNSNSNIKCNFLEVSVKFVVMFVLLKRFVEIILCRCLFYGLVDGWGRGIRTPEYQYQKLVPYRLAIPHHLLL